MKLDGLCPIAGTLLLGFAQQPRPSRGAGLPTSPGQRYSRLDGLADAICPQVALAQGDGQVLGTIGFQQGHLAGSLLCCLVLGADEIEGRALGLCLEQFFKLVQVQVLAGVTRGKVLWSHPQEGPWQHTSTGSALVPQG